MKLLWMKESKTVNIKPKKENLKILTLESYLSFDLYFFIKFCLIKTNGLLLGTITGYVNSTKILHVFHKI